MARTVNEIQNQIQSDLSTNFAAVGITIDVTTWSRRNIMRLMCFTIASAIAYLEQLMDNMKSDIDYSISTNVAASALWIQTKMFAFQFSSDALNQQFLKVIDAIPQYPVIDSTLCIIKACAVTSTQPNEVIVKVAKIDSGTNTLTNLDALTELIAAQSYMNQIGTCGIRYFVKSQPADRIRIGATIYYNGQYISTIKDTVKTTIENYLINLSKTNFNGSLKVSDLEGLIRNIEGVNDVVLNDVTCRNYDLSLADALLSDACKLVVGSDVLVRQWLPVAGYLKPEDTTNYTLDDTLNYISE